jgi:hypothetical protein
MKFIATQDFVQGLQNPLKIPDGSKEIVLKGTIVSVDDEMAHKDVHTFIRLHFMVPLDSERGKKTQAEIASLAEKMAQTVPGPKTNWHRTGALIGLAAIIATMLIYLFSFWLSH